MTFSNDVKRQPTPRPSGFNFAHHICQGHRAFKILINFQKEVFNKWVKQNYPKAYDLALSRQQPGSVELNDWIKKKLVGYVKNDLSTAGDPILKMANDGESIHSLDPFNRDEYAGLGDLDTGTWGSDIHPKQVLGQRQPVS